MAAMDDDSFNGWFDTSYDQPRTQTTVTSDIVTQRQGVTTSGIGDNWSGFFQKTAGSLLNYAVARDAAQTAGDIRTQQIKAQQLTPLYTTANGAGIGINGNMLLLIGAGLVAVLVLKD